ncbi:hypothetical protein PMAYCL1PPCAC_03707, partial [Pristionchus mayeri]
AGRSNLGALRTSFWTHRPPPNLPSRPGLPSMHPQRPHHCIRGFHRHPRTVVRRDSLRCSVPPGDQRLVPSILSFTVHSPRIAVLRIRIGRSSISVFFIYAPTSAAKLEERESFFEEVAAVYIGEKSFYRIIGGDLNLRAGPRRDGDFRTGPFVSDPNGDPDDLLRDFLSRTRSFHANSFFQKKSSRRWTWESAGEARKTRLELDHFITNRRWMAQDVSVVSGFTFPYSKRKTPRPDIDPLRYEEAIRKYEWRTDPDPSKDYSLLATGLKECSRRAEIPPVPPPPRLSEKSRFWIQRRGQCNRDPTCSTFEKVMAHRTCQASVKLDLKEHRKRVLLKAAEEKRSLKKAK